MASTFTDLGIEKMATGENAGTWGDKTNTNLEIVEKAISGYVEKAITSGGTTQLTITDGDSTESTSVARHAVIKLTGTISGNSIVTVPDSIEKVYIVTNGTSGGYTVQFKTASGSGITFGVSEKTTRLVYSDGTNIVDAGFSGASDMEGRELVLDADGDTSLTADTDDQIDIKIAGTDQLTIKDGALSPVTTNDIDLGTASLEFKDAFFDGTVTADAFAGPLTGNVTGNASGTAATVTTAAQSNITSLGTLTTLTVDNVIVNGSTIGHTSDTDLITVASGVLTVAGEVDAASLDISGDVDVDGTLEADAITINGTAISSVLSPVAGGSSIVTTGALNSGSITSGFGTIDTGSSTITTTGLISGGSLDIDDVLINGTTIGHTDDTDLITLANGVATVAGELSVTTLDIGGTNVTSTAAELNLVDGITAGTVSASLAVIVDSNKDITGFRNVTLTGELDAGSLDISGDADIDGTLEADAITVNGSALASSATTDTTNASNIGSGTLAAARMAAAQTAITSLLATDIKIGEDDQTKIDFETADEIHFYAANVEQVYVGDNILGPQSNNDVDLGASGVQFKDLYIDGVAYLDAIGFGTVAMTLPTADGSANQVLQTDGSGTLSFATSSGISTGTAIAMAIVFG